MASVIAANTAEGISSGTTVTTGNSGGSSGAAWDNVSIGGGGNTITADSSQKWHGAASYKFTQVSAQATLSWTTALTGSPLANTSMRCYFYISTMPTVSTVIAKGFTDAAQTVNAWYVSLQTSGRILIADGSNTTRFISPGSGPFYTTSTWYRLETSVVNGTSCRIALYAGDDTTALIDSGVITGFTTTSTVAARFGFATASSGIGTLWMDDMAIGTGGLIGPADVALPPVANAGSDQSVVDGATVTLSGTANGSPNTYAWTQLSGPVVTLSGSGASRTFTAPVQPSASVLVFGFTATNAYGTSSQDTVQVNVAAHTLWMKRSGALLPLNSSTSWPILNARNSLVYDTYRPDATSTGHITPRGLLQNWNDPSTNTTTITASNVVIQGKVIWGRIWRGAGSDNVVFKDCLFRGPSTRPGTDGAIVNCIDRNSGHWQFYDCTFEPRFPNYYDNAVIGFDYDAYRCRSYWVNDHYGIYTTPGSTKDTNVEIAGCLMESTVYWHGKYYANAASSYLGANGIYYASSSAASAAGTTLVLRPDDGNIYPVKDDGSHNDGIEVQGAYGGTKSVYIHGNKFMNYDAPQSMPHPAGAGYTVPVLGTQNNARISVPTYQETGMQSWETISPNGQCIVLVQNVNQFTQADTVWIEHNYFNCYGIGMNIQPAGYPTVSAVIRNNQWGPSVYEYAKGNINGSSIYPIRVYYRSQTYINGQQGVAGFNATANNRWDDPDNYWGRNGQLLTEGRNSGIRVDNA
ncbi:MAG: hypothetical protein WBP26_05895 [Candidatus Saccharimonadales bacterium]